MDITLFCCLFNFAHFSLFRFNSDDFGYGVQCGKDIGILAIILTQAIKAVLAVQQTAGIEDGTRSVYAFVVHMLKINPLNQLEADFGAVAILPPFIKLSPFYTQQISQFLAVFELLKLKQGRHHGLAPI